MTKPVDDTNMPDPIDGALRRALREHRTPAPSADFVDTLLVRVGLDRAAPPPASERFVDRVMEALHSDPIIGTRLDRRAPVPGPWRARSPKLVAAALFAATLLVAFWPGSPGANTVPLDQEAFPTAGANTFNRTLSLIRPAIGEGGDGAAAVLLMPPAPPLAADAGALPPVEEQPDLWKEKK